ncbi:MAG: PQQ-binding-like beta-propeller repeat protein [Pirellulaceae bacterium]|nr:PQQ-binding-like beta-propeller repeat protein [Pirellulaceae bacterium]
MRRITDSVLMVCAGSVSIKELIIKKITAITVVAATLTLGLAALLWWPRGGRPAMDDGASLPSLNSTEVDDTTKLVSSQSMGLSWGRFRGPNGCGLSDDTRIPTQWSDTDHLAWKVKLPGAGASSPILTEQYVFVTSYSGYGENLQDLGNLNELKRHLSCIQRSNGEVVWTRSVDSEHREDPYQGNGLPQHGYASNTPVTDGQRVFAFLGKSGVIAFDLQGQQLWQVSVGTESGNRGWGTAASLMLYENMVIVNAAEESQRLLALDQATGEVVWEAPAATLELCYSTPAIVHVDATRDDLVIAVPGEVWGMNPRNGKLTWYVTTSLTGNLSPSIIVDGTNVFAFSGYRSSGSLAIQAGGKGDVTDSNVLWTSRNSSYVATPVLLDGRFHWIDDRGMYYSASAETGELIHRARVPDISEGGRPVYASPIAIDGKIYIQTRSSGVLVLQPGDELQVIAQNRLESDKSIFNATPAVDAGQLFLRSDTYLYCVSQ